MYIYFHLILNGMETSGLMMMMTTTTMSKTTTKKTTITKTTMTNTTATKNIRQQTEGENFLDFFFLLFCDKYLHNSRG